MKLKQWLSCVDFIIYDYIYLFNIWLIYTCCMVNFNVPVSSYTIAVCFSSLYFRTYSYKFNSELITS